jgi:hypothetical protein
MGMCCPDFDFFNELGKLNVYSRIAAKKSAAICSSQLFKTSVETQHEF